MRKADIRVLIIEDDTVSGGALSETIRRAGFSSFWAKSSAEASNQCKIHQIHFVIIDCLLPQMNGVDLYRRLQSEVNPDLPVVFISGIFKDKKFAEDVIKKSKARGFLQKPFDSEELLRILEDTFAAEIDQKTDVSEIAFSKDKMTSEECLVFLQKAGTIHGFQLPQVIQLIMNNSLSGHLNLIEPNGEIASITFADGHITHVNKPNAKSYFGVLLIEKGFVSSEHVQQGLEMNSQKPLGEKLVELGVLSPHIINTVLAEQMQIRLSQIVNETSYDVNFLPESTNSSDVDLTIDDFPKLLRDWCLSKINLEWLKVFFRPFVDNSLQFRNPPEVTKVFQMFRIDHLSEYLLKPGPTLQDALVQAGDDEHILLRALYFLTVQKRLSFKVKPKAKNYDDDFMRLERLYQEIQGKGPFEVLGLSPKARSKEISKAYLDMAKALHPDKWGPETPPALRELSQKVFALIAKAYEDVKDDAKRQQYLKSLEIGMANDAFRVEAELERVYFLLQRNNIADAKEILLHLPKAKTHEAEIKLCMCWARAKRSLSAEKSIALAGELRVELSYIAPEERHSALYFHVRGLMYKLLQRHEKAALNFQRAIALDGSFIEAQKEFAFAKVKIAEESRSSLLATFSRMFNGKKKVG